VPSFGEVITAARRRAGLTQRELSQRVLKEDGRPLSIQYINDIENSKRNPPSEFFLQQLAVILELPSDYLFWLAGQLPKDLLTGSPRPEEVQAAFDAFRRVLRGQ
jgi:transcriptional regulator with XRE-family HTH domain